MYKWLKNQQKNAKIAWIVILAFSSVFGYKTIYSWSGLSIIAQPAEKQKLMSEDELESILHTLLEQNKHVEYKIDNYVLPPVQRSSRSTFHIEKTLDNFIDQYNKQQINEQHQQRYLDILSKYRD